MPFTESNTVESMVVDLLCGPQPAGRVANFGIGEPRAPYLTAGRSGRGNGWHYVASEDLPRQPHDVFVERHVRAALIRLNPAIALQPDRADEVIHKLRAIVLAVRSDGLIRANEELTAWLRGERSMPFGTNHEHVTVRLIDFEDLDANLYVATTQYTFRAGPVERRADVMLLVNGFPLVVLEAKTPVRGAVSWFDGAKQIHDDYERFVPELFVSNVFSVATEGKDLRYGAIHMPLELWGPWRAEESWQLSGKLPTLGAVQRALSSLLRPNVVLDMLAHFTLFATDKKKRRLKIVARYQQVEAANQIVQRVLAGVPRKGLIWHFQGSGKSLLMVFAAQKLRLQPALRNPAVLIVVDRIDLDAQISATFHASDIPNLYEAHRTQEGDLGMKMRAALPNNEIRDAFAADYSALASLWEALSPDPILGPYETDDRWLSQVYISFQPTTGLGGLIWHALGAKTVELIHENVHVYAVRDDLDEIVLDADLLEAVLGTPDPNKKATEIEFQIAQRLRRHMGNLRYRAPSERLEALKERHEAGQLHSVDFLKQLLDLAHDLLAVEKETPPEEDEDRGKAALTELFEEVRTTDTPVVVERIVGRIDEIVRLVRFPGWQNTSAGEREVRKALRKTLFDFKLHQDAELFDKAYGYIKQYY